MALVLLLALPAVAASPPGWRQAAAPTGTFTVLRAISGSSALAGGFDGMLARTTDSGRSWQATAAPTDAGVRDVSSVDGQTILAVDSRGTVSRSTDAGATWGALEPGGVLALQAFGDRGLLLVARRSLLRSTDDGDSFAPVTPKLASGDAFDAADRAGAALVVSGPHALLVSKDSGSTWKHMRLPQLARGDALLKVDFVAPRVGYVLTSFRRLFKTTDAGHHWRELLAAGGAGADLSFSDRNHGLVAAPGFVNRFDGYVLYTSDGGLTWRPQQVASRFLASVAAAGTSGYAIADDGSALYADRLGAEEGRSVTLGFRPLPRVARRGGMVRIRGRIVPAIEGAGVAVSMHSAGRWIVRFVKPNRAGIFSAKFTVQRRAWFVAQLPATAGHGSAASKAVFVPVR